MGMLVLGVNGRPCSLSEYLYRVRAHHTYIARTRYRPRRSKSHSVKIEGKRFQRDLIEWANKLIRSLKGAT